MAQEQTASHSNWWQWFIALGPAFFWFAHLNINYILVPISCAIGGRIFMYIASLILGGLTIFTWIKAWGMWRELREEERTSLLGEMEGSRRNFMIYTGLLSSGVFLLAIILATLPTFFLNPCTMGGRI
jgi:hypothetical protein